MYPHYPRQRVYYYCHLQHKGFNVFIRLKNNEGILGMPKRGGGLSKLTGLVANSDIRNLWITGAFTGINRWTEVLVIGIFTYQLTGSALIVALIAFANTVPGALFGILVGAIGERFNKKTLLLIGYSCMMIIMVILFYIAHIEKITLWLLALGTFLSGTFGTMEYPFRRTLLGEAGGLNNASSCLTFDVAISKITMFSGPLLGGFLMYKFGIQGFYLVAAASLGLASLFVSKLKMIPLLHNSHKINFFHSIRGGITQAYNNKSVFGVLIFTIILNFFGYSFVSMVPVIGVEKLGLSTVSIGILSSMLGAGALINLMILTIAAKPNFFMRYFVGGTLIVLITIFFFAISPIFGLALLVLFIGGLGEAGFSSMQATIAFTTTPPEARSRIMGLIVVCIGFGPLGVLHTGFMANWLGADIAIGIIAIEGFIVALLCLGFIPALRRPGVQIFETN